MFAMTVKIYLGLNNPLSFHLDKQKQTVYGGMFGGMVSNANLDGDELPVLWGWGYLFQELSDKIENKVWQEVLQEVVGLL